MSKTLQDTINWARPFIQYEPVSAGVGGNPAISIASIIRATFFNPPMSWAVNRMEIQFDTVAGTQDYQIQLYDFGFIEKVVLMDDQGNTFEIKDVYNSPALCVSSGQARPNAVSVELQYVNTDDSLPYIALRFLAVPDAVYAVIVTYQKKPVLFGPFPVNSVDDSDSVNTVYNGIFDPAAFNVGDTATIAGCTTPSNNGSFPVVSCTTTQLTIANPDGLLENESAAYAANYSWGPIPDQYADVYNNLFLSEVMTFVEDNRAQIYRQRGIAAFLAKASGLTAMQKNIFVQQWMARNIEVASVMSSAQDGVSGRGV
jgi:hypothetical protein